MTQQYFLRPVDILFFLWENETNPLHMVGTTGKPKGVLSTQRQFLTNLPNVSLHFVHGLTLIVHAVSS